ncbi:MAG TPA: substrate-binding domain-containing protein [Rariglobus sp.]|nr:substrate-binding domain-containing protein [Rariglobus sp.]
MPATHLVDQAENQLRAWLESSAFSPGTRLPSERALATRFGLHHYAMNRAMGRMVAGGEIARDGYKLTFIGKSKAARVFNCHLIVSRNSVHTPGYRRVAKKMGIGLTLHPWLTVKESLHILDTLDVGETDGVVFEPAHVLSHPVWEKTVARMDRRGVPVICLGQPVPGRFSVLPDNAQALQLAVSHLMDLGHREIGLVTAPPDFPAPTEIIQAWADICRKHALTASADRIHLQSSLRFKDDAAETARVVAAGWSDATALIVSATIDPCNLPLLADQLARHGRRVPDDLSLLLAGTPRTAQSAASRVSSTGFDMALMQELAFYLARRAVREKQPSGVLPPASCLRVQCQMSVRDSTQPPASLRTSAAAPVRSVQASPARPRPSAASSAEERRIEASLRATYPLAARASLAEHPRFSPLDLRPYVNRPLNFRRGWLGDLPLKQFPPGPREIHGVPFEILGGLSRAKFGAIVLQSAVNTVGNARPLPDRITIPIRSKVKAAYILHGCGYARFLQPFACYSFHGPKSLIASVPLVSLGRPPAGFSLKTIQPPTSVPNIQDWWSDFPHMDFPSARMVPAKETNDAGLSDYICLYTLEWINPSPETRVSHLEITSNPDIATSLGVLAVTILEP